MLLSITECCNEIGNRIITNLNKFFEALRGKYNLYL